MLRHVYKTWWKLLVSSTAAPIAKHTLNICMILFQTPIQVRAALPLSCIYYSNYYSNLRRSRDRSVPDHFLLIESARPCRRYHRQTVCELEVRRSNWICSRAGKVSHSPLDSWIKTFQPRVERFWKTSTEQSQWGKKALWKLG